MAPEFAVYSGYQMDRQTFKAFASGLPGADDLSHSKKRRDFMNYILAFNAWKNQLPPKQKRYVPRFRFRYSPGDSSARPQKEFITHVFFPFRFVEYKGDNQLTEGHPDNSPISKETPADEAKLDSLIQFLKERGGVLERDMVTFTYMKELHPSVDWRNVWLHEEGGDFQIHRASGRVDWGKSHLLQVMATIFGDAACAAATTVIEEEQ